MPLDHETLAKLTESLSGDIELYNKVTSELQSVETALSEKEQQLQTTAAKLQESEQRGQGYLTQISNLLTKIPIGSTATPLSMEQKMEEIKNRTWEK